jgi:hypothetical protein
VLRCAFTECGRFVRSHPESYLVLAFSVAEHNDGTAGREPAGRAAPECLVRRFPMSAEAGHLCSWPTLSGRPYVEGFATHGVGWGTSTSSFCLKRVCPIRSSRWLALIELLIAIAIIAILAALLLSGLPIGGSRRGQPRRDALGSAPSSRTRGWPGARLGYFYGFTPSPSPLNPRRRRQISRRIGLDHRVLQLRRADQQPLRIVHAGHDRGRALGLQVRDPLLGQGCPRARVREQPMQELRHRLRRELGLGVARRSWPESRS